MDETSEAEYLADLRRRTIAVIWEAVQASPEETTESIILGPTMVQGSTGEQRSDECRMPTHSLPGRDEGLDLEELAVGFTTIIDADYDFGMIGGWERVEVYDLGDGFLYLTESVDEVGEAILAIVPKPSAAPLFRKIQVDWLQAAFRINAIPSTLKLLDLGQVWIRREATRALLGDDLTHIRSVIETALPKFSADDLRELWFESVEQRPAPPDDFAPPGLGSTDGLDQSFDSWVGAAGDRVANIGLSWLFWRDTGESLSVAEARSLRIVCQYFAANSARLLAESAQLLAQSYREALTRLGRTCQSLNVQMEAEQGAVTLRLPSVDSPGPAIGWLVFPGRPPSRGLDGLNLGFETSLEEQHAPELPLLEAYLDRVKDLPGAQAVLVAGLRAYHLGPSVLVESQEQVLRLLTDLVDEFQRAGP